MINRPALNCVVSLTDSLELSAAQSLLSSSGQISNNSQGLFIHDYNGCLVTYNAACTLVCCLLSCLSYLKIQYELYIQLYSHFHSREKWLAVLLQTCDWFTWGCDVKLMTSVQWCSRFFTVLFHGFPGVFDQHRQRGESGCYGFYIHGDLHLGKRTSRQPPSLCCWLHTQERGDTICLQKRALRKTWTYGVWEILDAKTFWKSLHCV